MSFVPVLSYLGGLAVFGVVRWFLHGVLAEFWFLGDTTENTYILAGYFWDAVVIVFIIFGALYLIRQYTKPKYQGGFRV